MSKLAIISQKPSSRGPELRDILKAITTIKSHDTFDLERMETLGDSFLKFASSLYLFHKFPKLDEGQLTNIKGRLVGNRQVWINVLFFLFFKGKSVVDTTQSGGKVVAMLDFQRLKPRVHEVTKNSETFFRNFCVYPSINKLFFFFLFFSGGIFVMDTTASRGDATVMWDSNSVKTPGYPYTPHGTRLWPRGDYEVTWDFLMTPLCR